MRTVDDLRRMLDRHTALAPDSTGMIELARLGAVRIRRRRRIAATVAAAVAALLLAVGLPAVVHRNTHPAIPVPVRAPSEMTISLAAGHGFTLRQRAATGARQLLVAYADGTDRYRSPAEVWAYDPGAYDSSVLPPGETVRVGGHDALLVPALHKDELPQGPLGPPPSTPAGGHTAIPAWGGAVVWQDPSGVWVTVSRTDSRAELLRLAGAIQVGAASPPLGPVGLSRLPDGLAVTHAETMETFPGMYAKIRLNVPQLGSNARPAESAISYGPGVTQVEILVEHRTFNLWNEGQRLPAPTLRIAGHRAWYFEGPVEARLLIDTGSCGIRVRADDFTKVTGAELREMMNHATYGSCTDKTGWSPVVD